TLSASLVSFAFRRGQSARIGHWLFRRFAHGRFALGVLAATGRSLFLLAARCLAGGLELFRALEAALQFLDHPQFEFLLEPAFDAGHQVPFVAEYKGNGETAGASSTGTTDAVDIIFATARHIKVDHQIQTADVETA